MQRQLASTEAAKSLFGAPLAGSTVLCQRGTAATLVNYIPVERVEGALEQPQAISSNLLAYLPGRDR